ncbi:MAG: methionine aminotransferase [Bacteroidetes bacterium GWA2_30_7]|nr:MAG: methionine aminotransferase [Bacteroidetes bacterium GWA2_30_7]
MISSKFPYISTSIFAVMSRFANEHNAINLSQGFPDFECSPELVSLVNKHMKLGHNQYAPMEGLMPLREIICEKTEQLYSYKYNPETEVTITAGATQALFTAISALITEGDEVIVFSPAYDCYVPAIKLNGGVPVFLQLKPPYYKIDWDEVQRFINPHTKMIILNSPHNPTGAILSASDLEKLKKITAKTNIIILSDEVYEHIIFDGYEHQSVARFPELAQRSVIISSFGKTFHTTGWKMGYCLAPPHLTAEIRKIHQFIVFCVNTPIQWALSEILKNKDLYKELGCFYQQKRDYFNNLMKETKFVIRPSCGTYFQLMNYHKISDEKDTDFAFRLAKDYGVAAIPVSVFNHENTDNKTLRFCFAKSNETMERAAEKLMKL